MSNPVPRGRMAAQEQANMLAQQCVVGWGAGHPLAELAANLLACIKVDNAVTAHPSRKQTSSEGDTP